MPVDVVAYAIALAAGLAAGFLNTLAGSGSFLTLPALIWMGLPPGVANATNRVGILLAAIVGVRAFRGEHGLTRRGLGWLVLASSAGALCGALVAVKLDPQVMERVIGVLMLAMLALLLLRPSRFLLAPERVPTPLGLRNAIVFFAIGVYGGFIQAGVGIFLLMGLVLSVGLPLRRANAVKLILVLVFTIPAFLMFVAYGQVRWGIGLWMAGGQSAGAYLAARFATRHERADLWIRRLLIVVLAVTAGKLLV